MAEKETIFGNGKEDAGAGEVCRKDPLAVKVALTRHTKGGQT